MEGMSIGVEYVVDDAMISDVALDLIGKAIAKTDAEQAVNTMAYIKGVLDMQYAIRKALIDE